MLKGLLIFVVIHLLVITLVINTHSEAGEDEWEIRSISNGQTILALRKGNVTYGDTLIFSLQNNKGKCDVLQELFTFYTTAENLDVKKIKGKIIPIKFNEDKLYAKASYVLPFLLGHRVMFSMGSYKVNKHLDLMFKYKTYAVTIMDENVSRRALQPNMIKNFKALDYFDVPNNSWNLKGSKEAIGKAQKLCLEYKESKIS
jgi:hypothetical protein